MEMNISIARLMAYNSTTLKNENKDIIKEKIPKKHSKS